MPKTQFESKEVHNAAAVEEARTQKNMSPTQLANVSGVSVKLIRDIEAQKDVARGDDKRKIEDALGVKLWAYNRRRRGSGASRTQKKKRNPTPYNVFLGKYLSTHAPKGTTREDRKKAFRKAAEAWAASPENPANR